MSIMKPELVNKISAEKKNKEACMGQINLVSAFSDRDWHVCQLQTAGTFARLKESARCLATAVGQLVTEVLQ
jgi:hypothetical protein